MERSGLRLPRLRPDPITGVSAVVLLAGAVMLVAGALSTGVTTDEPAQLERTVSWLENGWFVQGQFLVDGAPRALHGHASPYVYGPAFAAGAHLANVVAGNEGFGEVSESLGAYQVRHLASALLAALGIGAVGAAVWMLARSRRFALFAAAGLVAVPVWMGHGYFNPKDIPAAAGYTLLTLGLIIAVIERADAPAGAGRRLAVVALVAAGIGLGAGTRLALLAPFAGTLLLYGALRLGQRLLGGVDRDPTTDLTVLAGAMIGIPSIGILYPNAGANPAELLLESASGSSGFPYEGITLTAGQLLSEHPPWWYLPGWVGASYPLLLGGLVVLGGVAAALALARTARERRTASAWSSSELGLSFVLAQALALPIGAMVIGSVMYSGPRQHLYAFPALAILAGVGAARLWAWAGARSRPRAWRGAATVALCAALLVPLAEQALLFPYNYAYVNPVAGIGGVNDRWETDYWFASDREAISRVPADAELLCSFFLVKPTHSRDDADLNRCTSTQMAPLKHLQGTEAEHASGSKAWLIARKRMANRPPLYCEEADNVTRWLRGESVVMSHVLSCERAPALADLD